MYAMAALCLTVGAVMVVQFSGPTVASRGYDLGFMFNDYMSDAPGVDGRVPLPDFAPSSGDYDRLSPESMEFQKRFTAQCEKDVTPECKRDIFDALVRDRNLTQRCCFKVAAANDYCFRQLVEKMLETPELKPHAFDYLFKSQLKLNDCFARVDALSPTEDSYY